MEKVGEWALLNPAEAEDMALDAGEEGLTTQQMSRGRHTSSPARRRARSTTPQSRDTGKSIAVEERCIQTAANAGWYHRHGRCTMCGKDSHTLVDCRYVRAVLKGY